MVDRPQDLGGPTLVASGPGPRPGRQAVTFGDPQRREVTFGEDPQRREYKPESVIQAVTAANQELSDRRVEEGEEEDEAARRRRERALVRRPSYRKILTELGGHSNMISEDKDQVSGSESGGSEGDQGDGRHQAHQYHQPGLRVLPSGALITSSGHQMDGLSNLSMSAPGGGGLVQYAASQDGNSPFFVPSSMASIGSSGQGSPGEEGGHRSVQKREIRLLKNREAARECRRKKKEYIKCLENRVAVLENQNKALIEELKSLKELYTGGKMM